ASARLRPRKYILAIKYVLDILILHGYATAWLFIYVFDGDLHDSSYRARRASNRLYQRYRACFGATVCGRGGATCTERLGQPGRGGCLVRGFRSRIWSTSFVYRLRSARLRADRTNDRGSERSLWRTGYSGEQ